MTNTALIEKLEKAKEGSPVLSYEFLLALGWTQDRCPNWKAGRLEWKKPGGAWAGPRAPYPTEHLQDALNLVTIFHAYIDMTIEPEREGCDRVCLAIIRVDNDIRFSGTSTTPALALCVANLKALEAGDG